MAGTSRCVGGLTAEGRSLRLLQGPGKNWSVDAPFQIGDVWELSCNVLPGLVPPHVEDVVVDGRRRLRSVDNLRTVLLSKIEPWNGDIGSIFDGRVRFTNNNNGYVCQDGGVPSQSTGFWIPDRDLVLRDDGKHYDFPSRYGARGLKYVGEPEVKSQLKAGTLLRVSLARWWRPPDVDDMEERCYLQLSGWF